MVGYFLVARPDFLAGGAFDHVGEDGFVQETLGHGVSYHPGQRKVGRVALPDRQTAGWTRKR